MMMVMMVARIMTSMMARTVMVIVNIMEMIAPLTNCYSIKF